MDLKRKIDSFKKVFVSPRMTKPTKLGKKLIILATAPSVSAYFDYASVRSQFADYDIAMINFMVLHSQKELFMLKPKYLILMDPIYYDDSSWERLDVQPWMQEDILNVRKILNEISWQCNIITSVLADFENVGVNNPCLSYIRLSIWSKEYSIFWHGAFKRNLLNFGSNNVIMGALFFAITFGFENVALLGCPNKSLWYEMKVDGIHIHEHMHYYDKEREEDFIPNDKIINKYGSFSMRLNKRAYENCKTMYSLHKYAIKMNCSIINYSEGSMIDTIQQGELDLTEIGRL